MCSAERLSSARSYSSNSPPTRNPDAQATKTLSGKLDMDFEYCSTDADCVGAGTKYASSSFFWLQLEHQEEVLVVHRLFVLEDHVHVVVTYLDS